MKTDCSNISAPTTRSLAPYIGDFAFDSIAITSNIYVGSLAAVIFAVAVVLLGGLKLFLNYTSLGRAIRATSEDADTAELVGINARSVYAVAAAIAVASAGLAGVFLAMRAIVLRLIPGRRSSSSHSKRW